MVGYQQFDSNITSHCDDDQRPKSKLKHHLEEESTAVLLGATIGGHWCIG